MAERKTLNKYYAPDFDGSKLPRNRQKNQHMNIRTMLPMSICCRSCETYISQGSKFNCRKEIATGESYLGIPIHRFYIKCTNCKSEIIFKTNPKYSDYTVESGAKRNFEPWRAEHEEAEELGDTMKSLENKSLDNRRELGIDANLCELKSLKSRRASVGVDTMLVALQQRKGIEKRRFEEEDEELVKAFVQEKKRRKTEYIRRICDNF